MALEKVEYVNNQTVITADQMNAIQDAIIENTNDIESLKDSGFITDYTETDPTVSSWAKQPTKPAYTANEVGADPSGTASTAVTAHNTNSAAHNDIRLLIQGLTTRLNALANSDDTTLDQMAEVVSYIKSNRTLIDNITSGKVSVSDIVNDLTTNVSTKPLSAAQGVALKALIDAITIPTTLPNPKALSFTGAASGSYDGSAAKTVNIPTVPTALKNPNALTFTGAATGSYDGSAAKTVNIPTVPSALPNPNALTFTGGATGSYDGSSAKTVAIPTSLKNPYALKFTGSASASYDGSGEVSVKIPTALKNPNALIINGKAYDGSEVVSMTISEDGTGSTENLEIYDTRGAYTETRTFTKEQISNGELGELGVDLVDGELYTVKWNGEEYSCIASGYVEEEGDSSFFTLGNEGSVTGDSNHEPFVIYWGLDAGERYFLMNDWSESETVEFAICEGGISRVQEIQVGPTMDVSFGYSSNDTLVAIGTSLGFTDEELASIDTGAIYSLYVGGAKFRLVCTYNENPGSDDFHYTFTDIYPGFPTSLAHNKGASNGFMLVVPGTEAQAGTYSVRLCKEVYEPIPARYLLQVDGGDSGGGTPDAVQYTPQTPTEEQQMQARENLNLYRKTGGMVELMPETTQAPNEDTYGIAMTFVPEAGKTYIVNWNGTTYECLAYELTMEGITGIVFGNSEVLANVGVTAEKCDAPFAASYVPEQGGSLGILDESSLDESGNVTLSVYCNDTTIHTIEPEFLPNGVPYVVENQTEAIVPERTFEFSGNMSFENAVWPLVVGETYVVTWDGTPYECVCFSGTFMGTTAIALGNAALTDSGENTGEPFVVGVVGGTQSGFATADNNPHTASIVWKCAKVQKLDNRCLDLEWCAAATEETVLEPIQVSFEDGAGGVSVELDTSVLVDGEKYCVYIGNAVYELDHLLCYESMDLGGFYNVFLNKDAGAESLVYVQYIQAFKTLSVKTSSVGTGNYTVSITRTTYDKLPDEYAPDAMLSEDDMNWMAVKNETITEIVPWHNSPSASSGQDGIYYNSGYVYTDWLSTVNILGGLSSEAEYRLDMQNGSRLTLDVQKPIRYAGTDADGAHYFSRTGEMPDMDNLIVDILPVVMLNTQGTYDKMHVYCAEAEGQSYTKAARLVQVDTTYNPLPEEYFPEEIGSFIMRSSTEGSTKKFRVTVDDSGTLTATEIVG